jgi:hypothetical protein
MDNLVFNEVEHTYTTPAGVIVPGVTRILEAAGLRADFSAVSPAALEYRRALGQAVHAATHFDDEGTLDEGTLDPAVVPYLEAWRTFRRDKGFVPVAREVRVFSPTYWYAGTLDAVGYISPTCAVLGDLKLGDPDDAAADLQTAAYAQAYLEAHPGGALERWSVQLTPDRTPPYRLERYADHRDFRKFLAALTVFNEQQQRRRAGVSRTAA